MAGAAAPQLQTVDDMVKAIREAGRTPVQRNSFYEPVRVVETTAPAETQFPSPPAMMLEKNLATA